MHNSFLSLFKNRDTETVTNLMQTGRSRGNPAIWLYTNREEMGCQLFAAGIKKWAQVIRW